MMFSFAPLAMMRKRCGMAPLGALLVLGMAVSAPAAGKYSLAYWRESGAYENQAPPAGELGHLIAGIHVWDESGQPLAGKRVYTSWGVLLGTTDEKGYCQLELYRPNGYDFQVRDGSHQTDTTPVLSVERPPSWGHYSFEIGFLFKQDASNPGVFDTSHLGTINAQGSDPCRDLSAPHTRSLAYYSTAATQYCSDEYELGNWTGSHGQTFVANGNRIVAMKAAMAAGFGVHNFWTAQILDGGPNGVPVGPPSTSRLHLDTEYYSLLVRWGVNDVQVVPGRTYYLKITRNEGINAYRVNRNNYPLGQYFENGNPIAGSELMGMVVCGTFTNAGPTGTLMGEVRGEEGEPLAGAKVSIPDLGLYTLTAGDGTYALPYVPVGYYDVHASKSGYITRIESTVAILLSPAAQADFQLDVDDSTNGGVIESPRYSLQPFEATPEWSSTFDASWGSPANYTLVSSGYEGNALQTARGGTGSSVRALTFPVIPNTPYEVSLWIRCPSSTSDYWVECGYRLGANTAQSFDDNAGAWTLLVKFSDGGLNGNGDAWTRYTARFESGTASEVTVALKVGASGGTGPTVLWDQLTVGSLVLPSLQSAILESPTQIQARFEEPIAEITATNVSNYRLADGSGPVAITQVLLNDPSSVLISTEPQADRVDHLLSASNVTARLQPTDLSGSNGSAIPRVSVPIVALDETTTWRFHDAGGSVSFQWASPVFDDSAWSSGAGLFGYADGVLPVPIRSPLAPSTTRMTTYFRHRFVLPAAITDAMLRVRAIVDDGAVFWLNGVQQFRLGVSNPLLLYLTPADRLVGLATWEGPFDLAGTPLIHGTNVWAVEVHQNEPTSSDVVFGATLEALVPPSQQLWPSAPLSFTVEAGVLRLEWEDPGRTLQSATNVLGPWISLPAATSPFSVPWQQRMEFFRMEP